MNRSITIDETTMPKWMNIWQSKVLYNMEKGIESIFKVIRYMYKWHEMRKKYLATHSGFDVCDHALCCEFGSHLDTYEVLSQCCDSIDHASTISVFPLTKPISSRRRKALKTLYDNYLEKKEKVQIKENSTIRSIDEEKYVTLKINY